MLFFILNTVFASIVNFQWFWVICTGLLKVLSEPENFTEVLLNKLKKQNKKKEPFQYAMGL